MSGSYAYHSGDVPGLTGAYHYGDGGLGILGSLIPSSGDHGPSYLYQSLSLPADANKEYYGPLGTLPAGLTISVDENGAVTAAASDGTYRVPFDLYENGTKLGTTYFDLAFGVVVNTINLTAANSTETASSGTGAATVTPASTVVNLVAANSSETATSGTGATSVTPGAKTVNLVASNSTETGASGTGAVTVISSNSQTGTSSITVPASRTAVFAGKSRIAVFTDSGPVKLVKVVDDQLYLVGDFTKPLADGATTAQSVTIVNSSVTVLENAVAQGPLMVAKIGAFDPAGGQFTFRVTCANSEVIDGTIILTAIDDRSQMFWKDPDDHRYYAFDVSADLVLSTNTTIATVQTPVAIGVSALSVPAIQGGKAIVLIGGLDLSDSAVNSCKLVMTLATTEVINRTAYFTRQDH